MKRTVTFTVTLDTETKSVTALEMQEGIYSRVEALAEGIDDPVSIYTAKAWMGEQLKDMLD